MPANRHVKSIVKGRQGELVKCIKDPHVFNTPYGTVDEKLRPITGGLTNHIPTYEFVRINHYATQSREFYLNFKKRGGFATDPIDVISERPEQWWTETDKNDVYDQSLTMYYQPLKNILSQI
jgi:hypothetical protein